MTRDAAYRWVGPFKAWEYYVGPGLGDVDYKEALEWLREHVLAGRIRVELDKIEVTPKIVAVILEYHKLARPELSAEHPLPADMMLNRPDIQRALQARRSPPAKRPGRPKRSGSLEVADYASVIRMNQMISPFGTASSPTAAAKLLVQEGGVRGGGCDESKVRRLVKRYKETFGDDD